MENSKIKIILDVMGADREPAEFVAGAVVAQEEYGIDVILVGDREEIFAAAEKKKLALNNVEIVHTEQVINMDDSPLCVVKEKRDSSMGVGLRMLKEGKADAMVSAGNTGALHAGSTLIVRRIKGVQRSGIATILPFDTPLLLMDSGANLTVTADQMVQFGFMGSVYMNKLFGMQNPRVGLLNNGSEETKGTETVLAAYGKMKQDPDLNFVGNIEGKDIPYGKCDVLVTDGFSGNIVLKLCEGLCSFMMKKMKGLFTQNPMTKISALPLRSSAARLKKEFDATEYGGAPLLGVSRPVIKAHGSSDANAVKNALLRAKIFAESGVIYEIARKLNPDALKEVEESAEDER